MTSVAFLCASFLPLPPFVRASTFSEEGFRRFFRFCPAKREHTEAIGEILFGMVVKTRKEFNFLGAGTVVDGVVENEDVDTIRARQGGDGGLDDDCSEQCGEPAPMDAAGIHEAVEGILGKWDSTALEVNLHEERAMREDRREGDEEDAEDRKATMFVGIRRAQNTTDVVTSEEILHFLGQRIFRAVGLCHTVHGMSPPLDVFLGS